MSERFIVRFWGVRGSHPVPGPATVRYGGNTPSVEVQAGQQTIILDAGTGIIPLGRELARRARESGAPMRTTLLFSHMHHDHTQGFPFFAPAYHPKAHLNVMGPGLQERDFEKTLSQVMVPANFPVRLLEMRSTKQIRSLREHEVVLLNDSADGLTIHTVGQELPPQDERVRIRVLHSPAHPNGVYVYRIEWRGRSLVYATYTEGYVSTDRRLVNFARGADLLIHDAQYTDEHYLGKVPFVSATQGWGHSTATMACAAAKEAGVGQLVLFHFDPTYNDELIADIEARAQGYFARARAAYEGLEIDLLEQNILPQVVLTEREVEV